MLQTVQWNVIIIITIIINIVVVADVDAYYYWPCLSSHNLFQVNCKVRQHILLQSPGWSVITKCDSFVIIKCDNFIVTCDRYYKVQQNIPQAKMSRIPEYGALCKGRIFGRIRLTDLGYEKTTTITKTNKPIKTKQQQKKTIE